VNRPDECDICGDEHCEGEDFGTGMSEDTPDGCYCYGCEPCRKRFDLPAPEAKS
jgi:hypothetical protein